ncbi:MAG: TIR domain-containing protein, partial [Cyanobacteriota bacterium]|nr:TIR domain-containing protein [Cyanobacteriota bacterium]
TMKIEPTDDELLPQSIRSLEYIDLTGELEEAGYQEGVDKLIKELAENALYYQQHKVLLVKAIKWEQQNRNRSLLLRGYNLEHYQSWLEVTRTKNLHPPTDVQVEFIAESSKQPPDSALDVFISYSRADADFARRLNNALQSQGKTTWFDQESIATGTDFGQEIDRGIEQSDNFLFVISPDSVNSPYCADEVESAKALNKRFVTVLHRRVNTGDLHPELAKVQWLDFNRHGGDFLGNFSELVRTLDTDREYVRQHTKKSQKALEWSKRDKSVDLLLRGNECVRAYEWLQEVDQQGKQPELTELLKEYIVASNDELQRQQLLEEERQQQKIEAERQQRELQKQRQKGLILFGLLVFVGGLSIFAWLQTIKANNKSKIADAYKLAAESENAAGNGFYLRGTLLALESVNKSQSLKKPELDLTANSALRSGLTLLPDSISEVNHGAPVSAVALSPDGKYLATASDDNTAGVWLAATGKEVAKVNHDAPVSAVALSPDGKYLATASDDNTAGVWLAATGKEVAKVNHDAPVRAVAFSRDGKYLATASWDNTAGVWLAATGKVVAKVNHDAPVSAVAFSRDGKYLATASWDNTAGVWLAATGKVVAKVNHDAPV